MAARERLAAAPNVVGMLVPGDGRLRFGRTELEDVRHGDWVALAGIFGDEPAQIVFTPDQIEFPDAPADLPLVLRRLSRSEIASLSARVEQLQAYASCLQRVVASGWPDVTILGVRFPLVTGTFICRCAGGDTPIADTLARSLSEQLAVVVEIEWDSQVSASYGGVGRLRLVDRDLAAVARSRLGLDDDATEQGTTATAALPPLGAVIQTAGGPGVLLSISMRHQSATLRLESGEETTLPLNDML